jgi:type II secretion system protein N
VDEVRLACFGVRVKKALVGHEAVQGKPVAELSDIRISWQPWSLLTGKLSITSQASAYDGIVRCDVVGVPVLTTNNPSMTIGFNKINLAKYPPGTLPWFKGITGTADGSITRETPLLQPTKEKGSFRLTIRNGEIRDLYTKNLPGIVVPFKEITAEGRLEGSQAIIDRVFLSGSGITMKGSGTLTKGDPYPAINLKLSYESQSKGIPLPPKGIIVMSGSQWSPTVTVSTETPDVQGNTK